MLCKNACGNDPGTPKDCGGLALRCLTNMIANITAKDCRKARLPQVYLVGNTMHGVNISWLSVNLSNHSFEGELANLERFLWYYLVSPRLEI